MSEPDVHYICKPNGLRPAATPIDFLTVQEFTADEQACRALWDLVAGQFRTRSKFLAIWQCVRFVALHRGPDGVPDGLLLVSAPVNWQVDYVVVGPSARGQGLATALLTTVTNEAFRRNVPYVMLTSKPELRPLYEGCGFEVIPCGQRPAVGLSPTG
jgi:GNAT superfamily N-acetyltransferase